MCQQVYKNSMYISILSILLSIHFLNVVCEDLHDETEQNATVSFNSLSISGAYDITTFYRITNMSLFNHNNVGFKDKGFLINYDGSYAIETHLRTNAIGMPINTSNFFHNFFVKSNSDTNNIFNSEYWENTTVLTDSNIVYNFMNYKYGNQYYDGNKQTFFEASWSPENNQNCLAITYHHTLNSELEITMNILNENNSLITSTKLEKFDHLTTLKVTNMALMTDHTYKLQLERDFINKYSYNYYGYNRHFAENWFELIQISGFLNDDEDEIRIISGKEIGESPVPIYILRNESSTRHENTSISTKQCFNGGYIEYNNSVCICPPGFIGQMCEIGCGSNLYGADCKGICSMHSNTMCRGVYMCSKYGCTCPPGLTGPLCNIDCASGKYGNDCKERCSSNCHSNICDKYTGICSKGCSPGYVPPYCRERYPYLINPPTLLSNTYETIEVELNFQSDNIKGVDQYSKLKYYQLLYKSIKEDNFTNKEPKLINQNDYGIREMLSDLQPDTTYAIGVLVITDDGNFNDQDIRYSYFKTSCMQPQINDYNIKLLNGINNTYITWDRIISKRVECNVIEHGLTLTYNYRQNKIAGIQEIIISGSENDYLIENLYPGYQYEIVLTPKTSNGPLKSSPAYTVSPLKTVNDITIKYIVTSTDDEKIKVSWKLGGYYLYNTTVDTPTKIVFRYKLNRVLSCSLKELENNWTSVTLYNKTTYDIFNTVPNSQYCIQVLISDNIDTTERENMVYALTSASIPKISPVLDNDHPMHVTNNSAFVQWKISQMNCSKLNGFVSSFFVKLIDINENILQIKETTKPYIFIEDLKSNTSYKLKVFIKTHIGYNPEYYLLVNFTTKYKNLMPVNNVVVYKKSLSNRMIGLRWGYPDSTNSDGFIVWINKNDFAIISNDSVIYPKKCSAWPKYYCHTFYNLSPSKNYTLKIKPKSQDYPEGGEVSSISFNYTDGLPDPPNNLKTIEIGDTYMTLQWDIPWIFNGILDMFIIKIEEISAIDMDNCCYAIGPIEFPIEEELPTYNYTVMGLKPGSIYSVGILSMTKSSWYSSQTRIYATIPLDL